MPLIAVTRLRLCSARFLPGFIFYALRSRIQAKRSPGVLRDVVLNDSDLTYWTCTAWKDESAMRAFMLASPHAQAMRKLAHWCNEASVVHWIQDSAQLPDWIEAHRRMVTEGRRSRVKNPSPEH